MLQEFLSLQYTDNVAGTVLHSAEHVENIHKIIYTCFVLLYLSHSFIILIIFLNVKNLKEAACDITYAVSYMA